MSLFNPYLPSQGIKLIQGLLNRWVSGNQEQKFPHPQCYPEKVSEVTCAKQGSATLQPGGSLHTEE